MKLCLLVASVLLLQGVAVNAQSNTIDNVMSALNSAYNSYKSGQLINNARQYVHLGIDYLNRLRNLVNNLPSLSSLLSASLPSLPNLLQNLPSLPSAPSLPSLPSAPSLPSLPSPPTSSARGRSGASSGSSLLRPQWPWVLGPAPQG